MLHRAGQPFSASADVQTVENFDSACPTFEPIGHGNSRKCKVSRGHVSSIRRLGYDHAKKPLEDTRLIDRDSARAAGFGSAPRPSAVSCCSRRTGAATTERRGATLE